MPPAPPQPTARPQRDALSALKSHAAQHGVPLNTHLDLTYRCDLSCIHCYLEERVKHELTVEEISALLDDIADLGGLFLLLSGGDIFLRPDALDILRAAAARGFYISMITHAGHITEAVADELARLGVGQVRVSIYSSRPEVHDRITRLPGSLHASLRAIAWLRERGIPVQMKCPVFEDNPGAQLELPILAAKYDCTFQLDHKIIPALGPLPPQGLTGHCDSLTRLNANVDQKIDVVKVAYGEGVALPDIDHFGPESYVCSAGRSGVYIDPEGNVFPCLAWEEPAGNVRQTPFAELWGGASVFQRARGTWRKDFFRCSTCENKTFCEICPGKAYKETGNARDVSSQMCRAATVTRLALEDRDEELAVDLAPLLG